jgi:hypothetical protein
LAGGGKEAAHGTGALPSLLVVVLVLGGWFLYSNLPVLFQQPFQPLARHPLRSAAPAILRQSAPAAVVPRPSAGESAEARQSQEEAAALQKQKDLAWAAFYSAPASCEHPADWEAQVECGNRYIRAKKLFEQGWAKDHPASQGSGPAVVLDNSSIRRQQK